jgi:hypothetical protein
MLRQLLTGSVASVVNIAIHALVMAVVVRIPNYARKQLWRPSLTFITAMVVTVLILMAAHVLEVMVWACTYWVVDAAPGPPDDVYFAFVNYTTLGYGDIVPVERWRLLGPMAAMNGVLMFGWSTAVIFQVLRKAEARVFETRHFQ